MRGRPETPHSGAARCCSAHGLRRRARTLAGRASGATLLHAAARRRESHMKSEHSTSFAPGVVLGLVLGIGLAGLSALATPAYGTWT